jgi:hypothetical protein
MRLSTSSTVYATTNLTRINPHGTEISLAHSSHYDLQSCADAVVFGNPAQGSPIEARRQKNTPMKFAGQLHSVPASCVARLQAGLVDRLSHTKIMPVIPKDLDFEATPEWVERFHNYVDSSRGPDACWPYLRYINKFGYGIYSKPVEPSNPKISKAMMAHRAAFIISGQRPTQEQPMVLHNCHNRSCCNPAHLHLGTHSDNMREMYAAGRGNRPVGEVHWTQTRPHLIARGERSTFKKHPEILRRGDDHWTRKNPEKSKSLLRRRSKFTEEDVKCIRERYSKGHPRSQIAASYGVSWGNIDSIVKNKTWT